MLSSSSAYLNVVDAQSSERRDATTRHSRSLETLHIVQARLQICDWRGHPVCFCELRDSRLVHGTGRTSEMYANGFRHRISAGQATGEVIFTDVGEARASKITR